MLRLILPILLALTGAGAGVGAGLYLRPPAGPVETAEGGDAAPAEDGTAEDSHADGGHETPPSDGEHGKDDPADADFVKLSNQFIVPVIEKGRTGALVVMSLSLETATGMRETVFAREPKLRAAFLQVMFDYANAGGFDGNFTSSGRIEALRRNLREAALPILGSGLKDILITDIARQES